jgi:hypothetical protein
VIQLNMKIISQEDSVNLSLYSSLSIRNIRNISAVDMFFFYRPKAEREEVPAPKMSNVFPYYCSGGEE